MAETSELSLDVIAEAQRQWTAHGWEDAAPGMAAVTSVMRVQQIFLARADHILKPLGLTFARYELLMLLLFSRAGALPLNKIGARLQVHPTSVTNAVDRLEASGFVTRIPHETDRRAILARITPAGRRVAQRATKQLNEQHFARTGLSPHELRDLVRLLGRLRADAGDF